jgi:3'(2'), 5'-bisphosphate nucleotidase
MTRALPALKALSIYDHSARSSGAALPTDPAERNALGLALGRIAVAAGQPVLDLFRTGTSVRTKSDASPVTEADLAAEKVILRELRILLPEVPVISEEQTETHQLVPDEPFVLVDPLDGTREFIAKREEFTINIAVIAKGQPIAGAVYAPALGQLWYSGAESFRLDIAPGSEIGQEIRAPPVKVRSPLSGGLSALVSRSHSDPATEAFLAQITLLDRRPMGSSLKFCRIAEGSADLYVRLGPTHEWDTAAGDAILTAAGGQVVDRSGSGLRYGKTESGFRHEGFIASGGLRVSWDKDAILLMP